MPLSAEARANFNETAAVEFFHSTVGHPYGYHNFLFGWIDTPTQNYPPLLPPEFLPIVLSMYEKINPFKADRLYFEAVNLRLGTRNKTAEELTAIAAERKMTMDDVTAMVEVEGW